MSIPLTLMALDDQPTTAGPLANQGLQAASSPVLRARTGSLDVGALTSMPQAASLDALPQTLTLNLFDDVSVTAKLERHESDALGHRSWVGSLEGHPLSVVALTWKDDILVGSVLAGQHTYVISGTGGRVTVEERVPTVPSQDDVVVPAEAVEMVRSADAVADGEPVVDLLAYYTTRARAELRGGDVFIQAQLANVVVLFNSSLVRSGVTGTLRLVGAQHLSGFEESGDTNATTELIRFRAFPGVQAARDAAAADLVHLVVAGGGCCAADIGPTGAGGGFGTSHVQALADGRHFSHEVGHNFGNNHGPPEQIANPFRPYSFGFRECGGRPWFVTIMASNCGSGYNGEIFLTTFSNPAVLYLGRPTGSATQNNARSMTEAFPIVASRRGSVAAPGAPTNLIASVAGSRVTLNWGTPGGTVTNYVVQVGTAPAASNLFNASVGLLTTVSGTVANGRYYARVIAQGAGGFSPASNEVTFTIGGACSTEAPVLTGTVVGNTLSLSWSTTTGDVTGYTLHAGRTPGASDIFSGPLGPLTQLSAAPPSGTYYVRVVANRACGNSPPSNELRLTVP